MEESNQNKQDSSDSSPPLAASPASLVQESGTPLLQRYEPEPNLSGLNIYQRIREIRRAVHGIDKTGKHNQGWSFVRHDDVTAALSGAMVKYGVDREVSVIDAVRTGRVLALRVRVDWVNVDDPRERKSVEIYAEGVDQGKNREGEPNIDGLTAGKAISYAVKTAELKNFCLVGDGTPDSERSGGGFSPGSVAAAPEAKPPSDNEYAALAERYRKCASAEELQSVRELVSPLVLGKKLSPSQIQELSSLDNEAKKRSTK